MSPAIKKNKLEQLTNFLEDLQEFEGISYEDFQQKKHYLVAVPCSLQNLRKLEAHLFCAFCQTGHKRKSRPSSCAHRLSLHALRFAWASYLNYRTTISLRYGRSLL
jgi:hypothetical protein